MKRNIAWRLVTDLVGLMVVNEKEKSIYLASAEKPIYKILVSKQISDGYEEIYLNNEFSLKLKSGEEEGVGVYIKSPDLPDSKGWYLVKNTALDLGRLIEDLDISKGQLDYTFEAIFSDDLSSSVSFVCSEMKNYRDCYNEMVRRLNCEIHSKTKKWKVGHRYDTDKETWIYLGEFKSRKLDPSKSNWTVDAKRCPEVHLVVGYTKDNEKTVSDVLKNRVFGEGADDIHVLSTTKLMVDGGEVLKNDVTDISIYWPEMVDYAISDCRKVGEFGYVSYDDISKVFNIFTYFSESNPEPTETIERITPKIVDLISTVGYDKILSYFETDKISMTNTLKASNSIEDNKEVLTKLFYLSIHDVNILRCPFYISMIEDYLKIDVEKMFYGLIEGWIYKDEVVIFKDFDKYLFNYKYINSRFGTTRISQIVGSSKNYLKDELAAAPELVESLKKMVRFIVSNYGLGATIYKVNKHPKESDKDEIYIKISLPDLLLYLTKGGKEVPEILKNEIMSSRFCQLSLYCNRNTEIQ